MRGVVSHDPRTFHKYAATILVMMAILMLCTLSKSRRGFQNIGETSRDGLCSTLATLTGEKVVDVPHVDTMNNFLETLDPSFLIGLITQITGELIRQKVLNPLRRNGKLPLYIDATELMRSRIRHCQNCLTTVHNRGTPEEYTEYHHAMLLSCIIAPNGLVVPVAVEFLENVVDEHGNLVYDKQDCESNSLYRLEKQLCLHFPKTQFYFIFDGLYTNQNIVSATVNHGGEGQGEYSAVLKEKSCPAVRQEIRKLLSQQGGSDGKKNCLTYKRSIPAPHKKGEPKQWHTFVYEYSWCSNVTFGKHSLHFITFTQSCVDRGGNRIEKQCYHNEWLTTDRPNAKNVAELVDLYRRRWKIENEGNQTQKKEYGLEHGFGTMRHAWKNYPLLIQIAQLFNSLARLSDLGERERRQLPNAPAVPPRKKIWQTLCDFAYGLWIGIREHDPYRMAEAHARFTGMRLHLNLLEPAA
jgi:hypothetical protein